MLVTATALSLALACSPPAWRAEAASHPLVPVVRRILSHEAGQQPPWKLPMVLNGLLRAPTTARCTTYCELCPDGGGRGTRWGSRIRRGIVAADPRYWGPGSVVYLGPPVDEVLIVEDTGSAIRGRYRFDVCVTGHHALCSQWGTFRTVCVPLHWEAPRRRWGDKPAGWHPPVWELTPRLIETAGARIPSLKALLTPLVASLPGSKPG